MSLILGVVYGLELHTRKDPLFALAEQVREVASMTLTEGGFLGELQIILFDAQTLFTQYATIVDVFPICMSFGSLCVPV